METTSTLNRVEAYSAMEALRALAEGNRRKARSRSNAGSHLAHVRKVLRSNAGYFDRLADRIKSEHGFG